MLISPPPAANLIVRGRRVVTPEGERPAAVHVRDGVITAVSGFDDIPAACAVHEAGDSVVMPGLVDTHVHINEPGRTEWEGFATATRAAAAGGVTTLIEMPLNSIPPTTSVAGLGQKIAATANQLWVDVGFWGGVVPGNLSELQPLWQGGVFGFKCFLVPSGVVEFREVCESDLRAALPELAALGAPLLVHSELPGPIEEAVAERSKNAPPNSYSTWLASRPRNSEDEAIALLLRLAEEFRAHIHIVHLSSSNSIDQLRKARKRGFRFSVETCPHYLTFVSDEIADGATQFKCAPPIRERENREKLWTALREGTIDFIVSDHSPCPPAMKLLEEGDFLRAWGGISSLQIGLPTVWTQARSRSYALTQVTEWMCRGPARFAGLEKRKGAIAVGCDADLVIWNPDAKFGVDPSRLHHRHNLTPYTGRELFGVVETTFLRGQKIFDSGAFLTPPAGRVLYRDKA